MCYTENNGSSFWFMTKGSDAPEVAAYFQKLGLRYVLFSDRGVLQGLLTKKDVWYVLTGAEETRRTMGGGGGGDEANGDKCELRAWNERSHLHGAASERAFVAKNSSSVGRDSRAAPLRAATTAIRRAVGRRG